MDEIRLDPLSPVLTRRAIASAIKAEGPGSSALKGVIERATRTARKDAQDFDEWDDWADGGGDDSDGDDGD